MQRQALPRKPIESIQALRAIDEAVKLVPKSERVRFLRGQILQRLGRTEEAKAEFATAKKLMNEGLQEDREKMEDWAVPVPELVQAPD